MHETKLNTERLMMIFTLITAITQGGLYLATGGFSAGSKLEKTSSELALLRKELESQNKLQDYRLNVIEQKLNIKGDLQ
ncbi:hypothetical protein NIES4103_31190 [Nostoc sp. NIES-4103]|nr:hypothetical protein NIES4103_31190 [Nostoc sp. NIES-4103]